MGVSCAHQEGLCEWWGWCFFLSLLWEPVYFSVLPKKLARQRITVRFCRTAPRSTSSCHVSISHSPPPASCWWVQLRKKNLLKRDLVQVMLLSVKQLPKETSSEKWVLYIPKRKETLMTTGWIVFNPKRLGITSTVFHIFSHLKGFPWDVQAQHFSSWSYTHGFALLTWPITKEIKINKPHPPSSSLSNTSITSNVENIKEMVLISEQWGSVSPQVIS